VADQIQVTKIADSMDYKTAAGMFLTYGTSYHALVQRANIQPEETLLVLGAAGSVSLSAVDIRTALGAKVIAAAFSDDKLELAKQYGAELTINYSTEDLKARTKELTGGKGADVIYDPVGGDLFKQSLRAIARKGRMLVVGFASGEIPKLPVNLVLLKDCQVVGVFWGQFMRLEPDVNAQNVEDLVRMFEEGKIRPLISETYPLEKAAQALEDMLARKVKGKVVLTPDSG
jgi:NADPH2:quinone reductase